MAAAVLTWLANIISQRFIDLWRLSDQPQWPRDPTKTLIIPVRGTGGVRSKPAFNSDSAKDHGIEFKETGEAVRVEHSMDHSRRIACFSWGLGNRNAAGNPAQTLHDHWAIW